MAMIYYGWGDVVRNKQFMGYRYCDHCGGFQQYYLSTLVYRVHIMYIPVYWKTKGYYACCHSCQRGRSLTKEEFRDLKYDYSQMKRSAAKKCFKDICRMCDAIGECTEANINYVMNQLTASYPIMTNDTLKEHYREAVAMRLEMNEQIKKHKSAKLEYEAGPKLQAPPSPTHVPAPAPATVPQVGSWICSCGAANTTKFCADCGAEQPSEPVRLTNMASTATTTAADAAKPAAVTVCPRCGKEDMTAPLFCSICGSPMNTADHR